MKISTANKITKIKIIRNFYLINLFKMQESVLKKEMVIKFRCLSSIGDKITDINKVNSIERKQINEYNLERETEILLLTNSVNSVPDINCLKTELKELNEKINNVMCIIFELNKLIPESTYVYNFELNL
jgi:hypothetical protein